MPPSMPAHLLLNLAFHLLVGFAGGGHDEILQHLDVAGHFGVDLHREQVLLAVHLHAHHAAAGRGFHFDLRDLLLQLLLHLLRLPHHLLHVAGHFHVRTPSDFELCGPRRRRLRGSAALPDWPARGWRHRLPRRGAASGAAGPVDSPRITLMRHGRAAAAPPMWRKAARKSSSRSDSLYSLLVVNCSSPAFSTTREFSTASAV